MSTISRVIGYASGLCVGLSLLLCLAPSRAQAYQVTGKFHQAERRSGHTIAVEEAWIHTLSCNGHGEKGGQYYIYQYVKRGGFRAILPPNWASAIGGRDWGSFAEAAGVACRR